MPGIRLLSSRRCLPDTSCGWAARVTRYLAHPSHISGLTSKRQRGVPVPQATADGIESPLLVPINAAGSLDGSSAEAFGPLAALIIGLTVHQVSQFRAMMTDLEAEIVKVVPCSRSLFQQPLGMALSSTAQEADEEPPSGTKRIVILSGMYLSEVVSVMAAYKDAGLPECLWAAAVPGNVNQRVSHLVNDVYGDDDYMRLQQP